MDDLDIIRYIDTLIMSVTQQITDLKALLDARFRAQAKALDTAIVVDDRALDKADETLDRRLDVINRRLAKLEQGDSNG